LAQSYKFGSVEVLPERRQVLVEGAEAPLGARAFDLLMTLIEQRNRVVSKSELLDLVWPGVVVEENNLQVQVSTLRKILGNRAIATLPGRGYRFTLAIDQDAAGPSCPLPAFRHNLPAQLNSFVGREPQTAALKEALINARLVTLTGPGGTGKSRLSLHVGEQVTADYPDGVWLVELSPVTDEARVPQVVAFALDVKDEAGKPTIDSLVKFVRERRMLLILDNCEHLLGACGDLARRLLLAAPMLKILASSREPLHVSGEARFPVPGLDIATEAVRLFVDRAVAVQPSFQLTPANGDIVSSICERLDGIPLAIELAAARVATIPVDRIKTMLGEAFRVLTQGDRGAPTRQQTLRASIDWSYDLLSLPERITLRRLAVFAGGWNLDAADAIIAGGDIDRADVFDVLNLLVEKSLVDIDARGERYRLLDVVRQYALELLQSAGELESVRERHVRFFVEMAEKTRREIGGATQAGALARLDAEIENLLSAHAACVHLAEGVALGLRLNKVLRHYWIRGGRLGLGIGVALETLARMNPTHRNAERASALFDVGQLSCFSGQFGEAKRYMHESLAIARELGDARAVEVALQMLGMASVGEGDAAGAVAHIEEAVAIAEKLGDLNETAAAVNALAQCHRLQGHLDIAEGLYQRAMTLASQGGSNEILAIVLLNLSMIWIDRSSPERARSMLLEVFAAGRVTGSRTTEQSTLEVCAGLAALRKDWATTARFYGAAEAMAAATGLRRDPVDEAFLAPRIHAARQELGAEAFEATESQGRALPAEVVLQEARAWLDAA
jgi:predicted ATPase